MKSFLFCCIAVLVFTFCQAQSYFSPPNIISSGVVDSPSACTAGDIDGDGDIDILAGSEYYYQLVWFDNLDGAGNFGPGKIISSNLGNVTSISLFDLDVDGDLDILAALGCNKKIIWFENLDGHGIFSSAKLITASLEFAFDAQVADIDGDGRSDIIAASRDDGEISWFKNRGGHISFGPKQVISASVGGAKCVKAADLDGDGDLDVISDAYWDNFIAWHRNNDGLGTFDDLQIISDSVYGPMSIFTADIDGDGDMDVLSSSPYDRKVAWYQNMDGKGNFGPQRLLSDSVGGPNSLFSCDIDNDGDMDVVATTWWTNQVFWFENLDGHGNFGAMNIILSGFNVPSSLFAADLDGDKDPDIIATSYELEQVVWFQNITLQIITQPQNGSLCTEQPTTFSISAKDYTGLRWQVNTGSGFEDLTNNSVYSGTTSTILQIAFADTTMSGFQYRCRVNNSMFSLYSDEVTLTIGDHSPPVISNYPGDHLVYANNQCNSTLADYAQSVIVTDICDTTPTLVQNPIAGTVISGAVNTITLTATDHANNISAISFNIDVHDTIAPVLTAYPGNQRTYATGYCSAALADYTQSLIGADNCDTSLEILQDPHPGTLISGALNTITLKVSDHSNNTASIRFNVEVADTITPVIHCPESRTIELNQGKDSYVVTGHEFDPVSGTDNCTVESVLNDLNHSGTLHDQVILPGTTTVTWQIVDNSGNHTGCSYTITLNLAKRGINIYPNPTPENLFFEFNRDDITKIMLFDFQGKLVFEKTVTQKIEEINLSGLPAGLYIVRITALDEILMRKVAKIN